MSEVYGLRDKIRDDKLITKEFSKIASETIDCYIKQDPDGLKTLLNSLLEGASSDTVDFFFDKLAALEDDVMLKEAWTRAIPAALAGASLIGASFLPGAVKHLATKSKAKKVFKNVVEEEPALRENLSQSKSHFNIIKKFSPSLLDAPTAVKNIMNDWQRMGGKNIQPEMIKKLMEVEKVKEDTNASARRGSFTSILKEQGVRSLTDRAIGSIGDMYKERSRDRRDDTLRKQDRAYDKRRTQKDRQYKARVTRDERGYKEDWRDEDRDYKENYNLRHGRTP